MTRGLAVGLMVGAVLSVPLLVLIAEATDGAGNGDSSALAYVVFAMALAILVGGSFALPIVLAASRRACNRGRCVAVVVGAVAAAYATSWLSIASSGGGWLVVLVHPGAGLGAAAAVGRITRAAADPPQF